jgi:hypothetical protein
MFSKFPTNVRDERQLKSLTGASLEQFNKLEEEFGNVYLEERKRKYEEELRSGNRVRKMGCGRKSLLFNFTIQLFYILYYLKNYPTFDVLASKFSISRSKACMNVHKLLPILKISLINLKYLPYRKFHSPKEFAESFKGIEIFIADATERPIQRPTNDEKQAEVYSGKRKDHTIKNTIISAKNKVIYFLGNTFSGSLHDFNIFKTEFDPELDWFNNINLYVDLGYTGINSIYINGNIMLPHKTPRKSKKNLNPELTPEQKRHNSNVGRIRVFVENAIAGLKRYKVLVHDFRNKIKGFDDSVIAVSAGLWNMMLGGVVR